jgi:hypothetical protein
MADCFPGEIVIGGKVPSVLLEEFLGEVASTYAFVGGYEGAPFGGRTAEELRGALDENGHLRLADPEARFGQFEELEEFCVRHGIPFDRHSDARYEFDAVNVMFRPGMEHPVETASNNAGDALADVDALRPVTRELARLATAGLTKNELLAAVAKASRDLEAVLPPEVEALPPLEIIGEQGT